MTRGSIQEYTEAGRERYLHGSKKEKSKILDEFTKVTGRHRKTAIRLRHRGNQARTNKKRGRHRQLRTLNIKGFESIVKRSHIPLFGLD